MYDAEKNPMSGYLSCNVDESTDVAYYGYQAFNGSWYIIHRVSSTGTALYATSRSNYGTSYSDAWTGRASLTYTLPVSQEWL